MERPTALRSITPNRIKNEIKCRFSQFCYNRENIDPIVLKQIVTKLFVLFVLLLHNFSVLANERMDKTTFFKTKFSGIYLASKQEKH